VRAPERVFELLSTHWKNNQEKKEKESWPTGNTYVNYWKAPTYMVNVEDNTLRGAGYNLKRKIWEGVKPILEEWTGMELEPSSMYGVREYTSE
jgi:prolyl 4-hydroxylase